MIERESRPAIHETAIHCTANSNALCARRRSRRPVAVASRLAFKHATARRRLIYNAILALLDKYGALTGDALYRLYVEEGYPPRSRQNIGTARRELADAGKVQETGARGLSDLGNPARLWERVPNDTEAGLLGAAAKALASVGRDVQGVRDGTGYVPADCLDA